MGENFDFKFMSPTNAKQAFTDLGSNFLMSLFKLTGEAMESARINGDDLASRAFFDITYLVRALHLYSSDEVYIKKPRSFEEPVSASCIDKAHIENLNVKKFFEKDLLEIKKLYLENHKNSEDNGYSYKFVRRSGIPVNIDASKINKDLINSINIFDPNGQKAGYVTDLTEQGFCEAINLIKTHAEMYLLKNKELREHILCLEETFKFDVGVNLPVPRHVNKALQKRVASHNSFNLN